MTSQSARPNPVRGNRAPRAYGGNPGPPTGYRCGTSVATGTSSNSPAIAGASVRMSCTSASGRSSATARRVSAVASTTASYISDPMPEPSNSGYSGAGRNRMPASSTSARHRDHVSNVTSWPRSASRAPSASIGKACPGSPNAPRKKRSRALTGSSGGGQLGHGPELLDPLLGRPRGRADDQRAHAGIPERGQAVADRVARSAQRDQVDQLVGKCRGGLLLLAVEVQVLDPVRGVLESVALDQLVVEVLLARAHPADVQGQERAHPIAGAGDVVGDVRVDRRGHVEAVKRAPRPSRPLFERAA